MQLRFKPVACAFALAAALSFAACGGDDEGLAGSASSGTQDASADSAEVQKLYEAAKQEGGVTWYSSATENVAQKTLAIAETLMRRTDEISSNLTRTTEQITDQLVGRTQDLTETMVETGSRLAETIVATFARNGVRLLPRTHRQAGFAVLTSAEIPAALVELGYLSNPQDEKLLTVRQHQLSLARALRASVDAYFGASVATRKA